MLTKIIISHQNKSSEIKPLTSIRGVAAVYVMLYHFLKSHVESDSILGSIIHHGYISVDLFFLLSGFVLYYTYHKKFSTFKLIGSNCYNFFVKRFARIYPLYLVVTLYGYFTHKFLITGPAQRDYSGYELLTNLLLIQNWGFSKSIGGPTWSLSLEWGAYILFPLICYMLGTTKKTGLYLLILVSFVLLFSAAYFPREASSLGVSGLLDLTVYNSIFPIFRCLGEFAIGMALCKLIKNTHIVRLFSTPNLDVAIVMVLFASLAVPFLDLLIVLLFASLILSLNISDKSLTFRLLDTSVIWWVGTISYSIYLVHGRFGRFVTPVARFFDGVFGDFSLAFATAFLCIIVILVSCVTYLTIEVYGKKILQSMLLSKISKRHSQ